MKLFNKEDLEFYLPDSFNGLSKTYILNCIFNDDIQRKWQPKIGDIIVGCTGNIFVISSKQHLDEKLGGNLYFFGGSLCSKDGGCMMNSTCSFLMNKDGVKFNDIDVLSVAAFSDFRYIPYPHELMNKFVNAAKKQRQSKLINTHADSGVVDLQTALDEYLNLFI